MAFDQLDATLQAVREGKIVGTVVQDPYLYGFEAVRLLCKLHRSEEWEVPSAFHGNFSVSCQIVDKENVDQYEAKLRTQLEQ